MSYGEFAEFYDRLTENIDYNFLARYYCDIFKKYGNGGRELLDLACGSGSLSVPLRSLGFNVTGCDLSEEMLTAAAGKSSEIEWLKLDMTNLPFEESFDFIVCSLDSLNHLNSAQEIQSAFGNAFSSLKQGGVFAADMNTVYKHLNVLGNNAFTFDYEGLYCGWQNELETAEPPYRVDMYLDFFSENKDGSYSRYSDLVTEIALSEKEVEEMLNNSGFKLCGMWEYPTDKSLSKATNPEKFTFAAVKSN